MDQLIVNSLPKPQSSGGEILIKKEGIIPEKLVKCNQCKAITRSYEIPKFCSVCGSKDITSDIFGLIREDNARGLCCEKYCGKEYTHFTELYLGDLQVNIGFCEDHYEKYMEVALDGNVL